MDKIEMLNKQHEIGKELYDFINEKYSVEDCEAVLGGVIAVSVQLLYQYADREKALDGFIMHWIRIRHEIAEGMRKFESLGQDQSES